jgi:hypothetical protein
MTEKYIAFPKKQETSESKDIREKIEGAKRLIAVFAVVAACTPFIVKHTTSDAKSDQIRPTLTTEQVVDNTNQNNTPELKIAK